MATTSQDVIVKYLQDCEAAERNFETLLGNFSEAGNQAQVKQTFSTLSAKAKSQHERLEARLKNLGSSPSTAKSALAHMLGLAPGVAQLGHEPEEKNSQHLMMTIAAAAAEMAMYESLATVAEDAGDHETLRLARQLQQEEREDYDIAWNLLPASARDAFVRATGRA
jgi:ferritin-like metal-binding protein YciE